MTEQEWLVSVDPAAMLRWTTGTTYERDTAPGNIRPSDRKLRLFACGCCRVVWDRFTDDVPCGRCANETVLTRSFVGFPGPGDIETCSDCHGTGRTNRSHHAVEVAERYADGEATKKERDEAFIQACATSRPLGTFVPAFIPSITCHPEPVECASLRFYYDLIPAAVQAQLLRCVIGNPYRPVTLPTDPPPKKFHRCPHCRLPGRSCTVCRGTAKVLAACGTCFDAEQVWTGMDGMKWVPCAHCPKPICPWLTWRGSTVPRIARGIYEERHWDCLGQLADALEDAGCPAEEAIIAHLHDPGPHCRGCWVVDLLRE